MKLKKIGVLLNKIPRGKLANNKILTSYISLFLAFVVLGVSTLSWFTTKEDATIDAGAITMVASAGMRVNNGEDLSGIVRLAENVTLGEASSVDGRNMFFPTTGTFTSKTSEMVFREGNAGDRNVNYFYKDFSLKSDSGETDVYVKSYKVTVGNTTYDSGTAHENSGEICPLRIAFITDSVKEPVLIDPTGRFAEYVHTYDAVDSIDSNGKAVTKQSVPSAFMQYYFAASRPIFTIKEHEELDVTMVMWLEGTGENCDKYVGQKVSVDIVFESNWDYMDVIEFYDNTEGDKGTSVTHWVNNDSCLVTMTYYDTKTDTLKTVMMTKSANYDKDYIWRAAIPQGITTNITFNRYNPKSDQVWNAWYTQKNVNSLYSDQMVFDPPLQESRIVEENGKTYRCFRYEALKGNGYETTESKRPYPCKGYWRVVDNTPAVDNTVTEETKTSAWSLAGTFNSWNTTGGAAFKRTATDGVYTFETTLLAGTYEFKVHQLSANGDVIWYEYDGYEISDKTDTGIDLTNGAKDNMILHASGGKYIFTLTVAGGKVTLNVDAEVDIEVDDDIVITDLPVNASLEDHSNNKWVSNAVKTKGAYICIVFNDGSTVALSRDGEDHYKKEHIMVSSALKVKGFVLKNAAGDTNKTFYISDPSQYPAIKKNEWYNYKINSNDELEKLP